MVTKAVTAAPPPVEKERAEFTRLLAQNPNYFGNLTESKLKPVKKIATNVKYEQLTCVGYNPAKNLLEATIAIKLPFGYGGGLCSAGTTEYVRFFLDYGSGWEDAGLTAVNVHDIPNDKDCAGAPDKPLTYVATLKLDPKARCCNKPVLPKVHAILSWQWVPPAGNPGWIPPWGNTLDCNIQIQPRPWTILCLFDFINDILIAEKVKVKIPPLFEEVQELPIPMPDPPPFKLAQLAQKYVKGGAAEVDKPTAGKVDARALSVEPHRFGITDLHAIASTAAFNQEAVSAKVSEWEAVGLNWQSALTALSNTKANVTYEELECLGLDNNFERLVATFRVKLPSGYSGDLCQKGSFEHVAFWADWDDTCTWTYLGTVQVNVHDIDIPKGGLCYSAILPVNLAEHKRSCKEPKIGRVRAVLSWSVPPSTTDPDDLQYWGNRVDTHVQLNPGEAIDPKNPEARIRNMGGIPIEDINTGGTGLTNAGDVRFAHHFWATADGWGLGRQCPFGGLVEIDGPFYYYGFYYRVQARKVSDPSVVTTLDKDFYVERTDIGFDHQVAVGGWFKYLDPNQALDRRLAEWSSGGDELWEVQLVIATAPNDASIVSSSPWYRIQLDNTGPAAPPASPPTIDIHIAAGGDCKDFDENTVITGNFIAQDTYFGGWSLGTEPNTFTTPSNQPQADPFLASTSPAPGPGGHGWKLDTANPVKMKPCGYVVMLHVSDRSIVHSVPFQHNSAHISVGFCLREAKK